MTKIPTSLNITRLVIALNSSLLMSSMTTTWAFSVPRTFDFSCHRAHTYRGYPRIEKKKSFAAFSWHSIRRTCISGKKIGIKLMCTKVNGETTNSNTTPKMIILGICGGIGSGKSTACKLLVDSLGCAGRIDADQLAHGVYEPGSQAWKEIITEFGEEILLPEDESIPSSVRGIDRKKLGSIVFSDSESMSKLEHIVWPHVRTRIEGRIQEITRGHAEAMKEQSKQIDKPYPSGNEIIIVEAALLMETDWHEMLDGLWIVQSSPAAVVQRLKENRGLTEEEALVRIHAQKMRRGIGGAGMSSICGDNEICSNLREEMDNGIVTAVITNDGTLEELKYSLERALNDPKSFKTTRKDASAMQM
mmetsp:Transcript_2731/g.5907  ORF Transcript_2731/g.5907 Transcript_2731/m.5907 type:complete len:361 (-) Transcript_2731:2-1084(-)